MARFPHKLLVACLALCSAWVPNLAADVEPYSARYSVYRNGKLAAMAEVLFERQGEKWTLKSELSGTHGLARLLRARDNEFVEGHERDGRFIPDLFRRHTRWAGIDDGWTATFDWDANSVHTVEGKDEWTLDLGEGALDPLTLKLEMRQRLNEQDPDMVFFMVDEDEIKRYQFRTLDTQWLETSLGCLETTPVERVRDPTSKRYTRAWHAPALDNIEVRIEHGKTGEQHVEMRITELELGGTPIAPTRGCTAMHHPGN